MDLTSALKEFADTFARSPENFGSVKFSPQSNLVASPFPLCDILNKYYSTLIFAEKSQIGAQFQLRLFSLDELENAQQGRRFGRNDSGEAVENPLWKSDWVVIAERNGDVLFVDQVDGSVRGNIQAKILYVADDLTSFFRALTSGMIIEMDNYKFEVMDDEFNLIAPFFTDIREMAQRMLGDACYKGFMEYFFG